jgi:putative transposase
MALNNSWGAPRIHGELRMLGFDVSERTVSRYLRRLHRRPAPQQRWLTFLRNHRELIAAMDLFVVFTVTFRLLYVLFIIRHGRREIVHFNVTEHPTAAWVVQQLREAFPFDTAPSYFIFDRDSIFSVDVARAINLLGAKPTRSAYRSPWQNGTAERWVGSARRELLDHVIVLNEVHLRRLHGGYIAHYHDDRTHCGLGKETPGQRAVQRMPSSSGGDRVAAHRRAEVERSALA